MKKSDIKRVLVISHLYPGNPQSKNPLSGIYVYDQISAISKRVEVDVLIPLSIVPRLKELKQYKGKLSRTITDRIKYSPENAGSVKYFSISNKHFDAFFIFISILLTKNQDYDIIHCHTMFPDGLAGMMLSNLTRKPFVVTIHGSEMMFIDEHPIDRALSYFILRRAKRVISVSELMKKKILEITKNKSNAVVIRNGIKEMFPLAQKENVILFAGKLIPVKDPEMLIDSFSIFVKKHDDYKLIIAGDGELRSRMESKIKELKLESKVHLKGFVGRREIMDLFSKASVLAITSLSEGFPTVIYESFSSGTPIVSFDAGGVKEAVTDDENGYIVKERSADSFAYYLDRAVSKDWDREKIREQAKLFLWENLSENIIQTYK